MSRAGTANMWHHGYRAPCILRAVAHSLREAAEHERESSLEWLRDYSAWLRATARELDRRAENLSDDAYDLVSDLASGLLTTLRLLRGAPGNRPDYLLCGLAEKDPEWLRPLRRRMDWLEEAVPRATSPEYPPTTFTTETP